MISAARSHMCHGPSMMEHPAHPLLAHTHLSSSMVFNLVPTALEVALVAGVLAYKCGPAFAALTGVTIALYTAFTFAITQARGKDVGWGVLE